MSIWRPAAGVDALRARAGLYRLIRAFFARRGVLEVETPLLASAAVTDPALAAFAVATPEGDRYLQTSPEYAMKRLLAAGSGDIYQLAKAFRAGESGRRHNPEFTLLEWYRLGFSAADLIRETGELLGELLGRRGWQVWPYRRLFVDILGIDPLTADQPALETVARERLGDIPCLDDRDALLDLLVSHLIEPAIAGWGVVFVVDYPPTQAALARCRSRGGDTVAARFECYVDGVELANGYWEAADAALLQARFEADNALRRQRGLPAMAIDQQLLAAVDAGLPDCAGVALGVDRLLALRLGVSDLGQTLAFPWERS